LYFYGSVGAVCGTIYEWYFWEGIVWDIIEIDHNYKQQFYNSICDMVV
jgi:hypothetical protein